MRTLHRTLLTSLTLAGLAFGTAPAMAGMPGGPGDCGGPADGPRGERLQAQHEARLEKLHKDLKLSADQEAAWKTFADKFNKKPDWQRPDRDALAKLTAPERLEKMLEMSKQHQALMSERLEAMKTFYATLTPEQKKTFDEHFSGPRGPREKR